MPGKSCVRNPMLLGEINRYDTQFNMNADMVPVSSLSSIRFLLMLGKWRPSVRKKVSNSGM